MNFHCDESMIKKAWNVKTLTRLIEFSHAIQNMKVIINQMTRHQVSSTRRLQVFKVSSSSQNHLTNSFLLK